jgi:hypothetical protein
MNKFDGEEPSSYNMQLTRYFLAANICLRLSKSKGMLPRSKRSIRHNIEKFMVRALETNEIIQ